MPKPILVLLLFAVPVFGQSAVERVQAALTAMGGEARLAAIHTLEQSGRGHTNLLEQSERPEGPWLVQYEQRTIALDSERQQVCITVDNAGTPEAMPPTKTTSVFADGVAARVFGKGQEFPDPSLALDLGALLALAPHRVLLTALAAKDLHSDGALTLQGVHHEAVAFTWQDVPVRVLLNADTSLPTAVEWTTDDPTSFFFGVFGEVTTRQLFSFWMLEPGGVRLPRQIDTEKNGQPWQSFTAMQVRINPELPAVTIGANAVKGFAKAKEHFIQDLPLGKDVQELADGIVQIRNGWNTTLIKQSDGIVVLEAPYSAGYSEKVIAEGERRFPGLKVKAAISTSDAWPHLGGVRGYVAHGIPVYILDLNRPILDRLVNAPFRRHPDALSKAPQAAQWHVVASKTVIGSGANAIELAPIRSETGERMMMVWFPGTQLLYGADLVQPLPNGGFFMPQYISELADAVRREHFTVKQVFAMHSAPVPWADLEAAIQKATAAGK